MRIKKIAVIGSGVMGSGIAALAANAGLDVVLLDIVPEGAENRNALAEGAIAKQLKSGGFTHPSHATSVTPGNLEDHLSLLADADWIIEAVLERLDVKQSVYRKINEVCKNEAIVSSNTSTLPVATLIEGMPEAFREHFMIAHFFNPPRHMRLLEVIPSPDMTQAKLYGVSQFASQMLGKETVRCKDTPGFIANRIGVFWMTLAMNKALEMNMAVEEADALMSRPLGVPKTGVFGLYDLIGIDLMPLIAGAMLDNLPESDPFLALEPKPPLIARMIADGYTGRKGKGGFYRVDKQDGKKVMQAIDLTGGEYHPVKKVELASAKAKNIAALLAAKDKGGEYVRAVMLPFLHYTASLLGEIASDIHAVDTAMTNGYNWKYGPFELIDQIGTRTLAEYLQKAGFSIPPILEKADGQPLYILPSPLKSEGTHVPTMFTLHDTYAPVPRAPGILLLSDVKAKQKPILSNPSASLWDMGDGVTCFEITTKMNAVDEDVLTLAEQSIETVARSHKAMVIGSDAHYFSAGANLAHFLEQARFGAFDAISRFITHGQRVMQAIKYAPFPVVSAPTGIALGGGCELLLHSAAVQAHMEITTGLVEVNVGLIPAWGGCKEMLQRQDAGELFEMILAAKTATSADYAKEMKLITRGSISMNRDRRLCDAKALAIELAKTYRPTAPATLSASPNTLKAIQNQLEENHKDGKTPEHQLAIGKVLAHVLSLGNNISASEAELLALEHDGFMTLIQTEATQARIEHMLKTGKPLRN